MFGPLGIIGTVIGLFTGLVYPAIYEKMGLLDDYNVLYNDAIRNNLFEVLILCSALGALLNLIPFCFYDLTENKHKAYVDVLKIRTMFENHSLGVLEDDELTDAMEIILQAKELYGKEKLAIDKTSLRDARKLPKRTEEEKHIRLEAIKKAKEEIRKIKETNLAIERSAIIIEDLNKFSGDAAKIRLLEAKATYSNGLVYYYEDARNELKQAKRLRKRTKTEKEIRADAIKLARVKKESASLIRKYGIDNLTAPDEAVKQEIINREAASFFESIKIKRELRAYMKKESVYLRIIKPYKDAENLIAQANYYTHYEELEERYHALHSAQY